MTPVRWQQLQGSRKRNQSIQTSNAGERKLTKTKYKWKALKAGVKKRVFTPHGYPSSPGLMAFDLKTLYDLGTSE